MILKLYEKDFFISQTQTIAIEPRAPQDVYPEHTHDFNEIVVVTDGYGKHIINGRLHDLYPGMIFYVHASDCHLYEQVSNLHITNILYRSPDKFSYINNINLLIPNSKEEQSHYFLSKKYSDNIKNMLSNIKNNNLSSTVHDESLFLQLLILLKENQYIEHGFGSNDQKINQLLRWLQVNFSEEIHWETLAEKFSLSIRTLHRKMKNDMNVSPQRYLMKLRLSEAHFLIKYTDQDITSIAQNCGFNDSSYFSTCFKNEFNITAKELRNNPN